MSAELSPTPQVVPPALAATQSLNVIIEPYQVGPQIKLKCTVSYLDPTLTQQNVVLSLQPQGLWNGLAPLINFLHFGVIPGYQIGGQGPQPQVDLSRISPGPLPPTAAYLIAPPPTVSWPYSRRTVDQHNVDAGELDASGKPTVPEGSEVIVRPPSYSGPYATSATQTEDAINSAALTTPAMAEAPAPAEAPAEQQPPPA